jgi:hypothetical protein
VLFGTQSETSLSFFGGQKTTFLGFCLFSTRRKKGSVSFLCRLRQRKPEEGACVSLSRN